MSYTECSNCGEEASGRHSVPVNNNCDFVPTGVQTDWAATPACEHCFNIHAAAGLNADAVLTAYAKATKELRDRLAIARAELSTIRRSVEDAFRAIGEDPQ